MPRFKNATSLTDLQEKIEDAIGDDLSRLCGHDNCDCSDQQIDAIHQLLCHQEGQILSMVNNLGYGHLLSLEDIQAEFLAKQPNQSRSRLDALIETLKTYQRDFFFN